MINESSEPIFERSGVLLQRKFFSYLLPTIMMNVALSLGMIVDGIIVGNILGTEAFAAVNICIPIVFLFYAIYALIGVGGSTVVAHCKGRMDHEGANLNFTLSVLGLLLISGFLGITGFVFSNQISQILSGGSTLMPLVKDYYSVLILGAPALVVIPGIVYFMRADSFPKLAANILIIANVVNLTCDLIYMGVFKMGISGAAWASVTGYLVGAMFVLIYLLSSKRNLKFVKPKLSELRNCGNILLTGLPSALFGITGFIKNLAINSFLIISIGPMGVATFGVCLNMISTASIVIGGTAQTVVPVVGCTYGEKDYGGIKVIIKTAMTLVAILCGVLMVIFLLFPMQLAGLFGISGDEAMMTSIQTAIRIFAFSLPFFGINFLLTSYYQTVNRRGFASMITVFENNLVLLPLVFLLGLQFGEVGIWIAFVLNEMIVLTLILITGGIIKKRSQKDLIPILLLEKTNTRLMDVTISNSLTDATGISKTMMDFCRENGIDAKRTNHVGVIVEELSVNIIRYGFKEKEKNVIDIRLSIIDSDLVLRFRDDGRPFNPVAYIHDFGVEKTYGLRLVHEMATDFRYSYVLNFNNTMISM